MIYLDQEYAINLNVQIDLYPIKYCIPPLFNINFGYDLTCIIGITLDTHNFTFVDNNRNIWLNFSHPCRS